METAPGIVELDTKLSAALKEAESSSRSPANGQETPVSLTTQCARSPSSESNLKQARLLFPVCPPSSPTTNNEENPPINQTKECVNTQPLLLQCPIDARGIPPMPFTLTLMSPSQTALTETTPTRTNPLQSPSAIITSPSSGQSCPPKVKLSKAEREILKAEREKAKMKQEEEKRERQLKRSKKRESEELEKKLKQEKREANKRAKEEEIKRKEAEKQAREEERIKKEENRKKAEMEKEHVKREKLRRKKEAFMGFFLRKPKEETSKTIKVPPEDSFLTPFSVKTDMTLATRPCPRLENTTEFDNHLLEQTFDTSSSLEMSKRRKSKTYGVITVEDDDDDVVEIKHVDTCKKLHYKLLQFHENYRPAYYGTWRKQNHLINPRNPFKRYEGLLDYEVDSDDEWEEEEPGESISNSEGDDGEDCEEGDDGGEDDGFFVPHGYLSDGEGDNDDGLTPFLAGGDLDTANESKKCKMAAKEKAWAVEFARKCQHLKPIKIGCVWSRLTVSDGAKKSDLSRDEEFLHQFAAVALADLPLSLEPRNDSKESDSTNAGCSAELTRRSVPEEAMPDLIRLMHESTMGVSRIIKTFRCYWGGKKLQNSTPAPKEVPSRDTPPVDSCAGISNSAVQTSPLLSQKPSDVKSPNPTSDLEIASGISKRQLEKKIHEIARKESRSPLYKAHWYIHDSVFHKYDIDVATLSPLVQVASPPMKPVSDRSKVDSPLTPCGTGVSTGGQSFRGNKKVAKRKSDGIPTVESMFRTVGKPSEETPKPKRVKLELHVGSVEFRDVRQGKRGLETGPTQLQSAAKRLHLEDQELNSGGLVDTASVLKTLDTETKENHPHMHSL